MDENMRNVPAVVEEDEALMGLGFQDVLAMAEQAEERVDAINRIMNAAIKITNKKDWVRIGDSLYLQESGAAKVASLFGVQWKINDGFPQVITDKDGYKNFKYRMTFGMGNRQIEAEGSRSGADDFFAGKKDKETGKHTKSTDEVDYGDVEKAALTSCINNGIKRLIPGLRNIDETELEKHGINLSEISGYTFKTGSQGGKDTRKAEDSGIVCENCGTAITQKVASYSQGKFGYKLCMNCQKVRDIKQIMDEKFNGQTPSAPVQKPQTRTASAQKAPVNIDESRAVPIPDDYPTDDYGADGYPDFLQ